MIRMVHVYRAEAGAQNIFGNDDGLAVTPPAERKPITSFEIREEDVEKARKVARDGARRLLGEEPEGVNNLENGDLSVTMAARRT